MLPCSFYHLIFRRNPAVFLCAWNALAKVQNCPHRGQKWTAGRRKASGLSPPAPRLRLFPPPKTARRRFPSALAVPATPPHVGATSDFPAPCGYALGCARKVARTADTGATAQNALPVTAASPAWAHPAPAKSPDRAAPAAYVPAACSRRPSFRAALLSLPHSGGS